MRLTINNFRSFKKKEIFLPDNGLVYLSGKSEAGKTTILESILWCFFGTEATRNVTPLGSSAKTSISMEYGDLDIKRSNKPNQLLVNSVQDEVAQGIIDETVSNVNHFLLGSYIKQKMKGCFLTLTPKAQLDFLNRLAIDINIDEILNSLKEKEKVLKQDKNSIDTIIDHLKSNKQDLQDSINKLPEIKKINKPTEEYNKYKQQLQDINNSISKYQQEIQSLIKEKNHPSRTAGSKINEKKAIINTLTEEFNNLKQQLDSIPEGRELLNQKKIIEESIQNINNYINNLNRFNKEKSTLPIDYDPSLVSKTQEKKEKYTQGIEKLKNDIYELKNIINNSKSVLICPSCNTNLKLKNNKLVVGGESVNIDEIYSQIQEKENKVIKANEIINKINTFLNFCKTWEGFDPNEDTTLLEEYKNNLTSVQDKLTKRRLLVENAKEKQSIIQIRIQEVGELNQLLNNNVRSLDELDAEVTKLETEIVNLNNSSKTIQENIATVSQQIEEYQKAQEILNEKRYLTEKLEEVEATLKHKEKHISELHSNLEKCSKLKSIITKSQLMALESVVNAINVSAAHYLDNFFPDCGTSIRILPQKINQDGSVSDKIGVEIIHNGIQYKNLDEFSGGAENRAILAFQLAISDLTSSPILLLDEPLTGVHEELRDSIYQTIKNTVSNKLVIVIEHNAKENLFDTIVEI